MTVGEIACTYAALLLHDDRIAVTAEKIVTVVKVVNVAVESYWPSLFAKLVEKRNIEDLITNVGFDGGGAPVAAAAPTGGAGGGAAVTAAPAVEEGRFPICKRRDRETFQETRFIKHLQFRFCF
ncbi:60S acidic ribosomal protein P1-like [Macadamia integrifolia]|uniref:60S acidic ribosomal protein P1-like n=1 Tax=Macadamia integrifolia TaxID=60698 RepID=UPI001C4E6B27|nr:60S acidic ribosomal protein P1-like [Macadamia integrifolia]